MDQVYFPQLEVVGDVGNAIWRISEAIKSKPSTWDLRYDSGDRPHSRSSVLVLACPMPTCSAGANGWLAVRTPVSADVVRTLRTHILSESLPTSLPRS